MTDSDKLYRFTFSQAPVRGEMVQVASSLTTLLSNAEYPLPMRHLLAEMSAAAALLTATLKFEGEISLQIQGKGPLSYAVVSCTHDLCYRGIARWDEDLAALSDKFDDLCAESVLVITISPLEGERYQGVVPLDKPTLAECVDNYFYQSEQLLTKVYLFAETSENTHAAGLLLQVLPSDAEVTTKDEAEDFHHFSTLADTLTANEILHLPVTTVLHRLYHEHDIELFDGQSVDFKCTCSKERSAAALLHVEKAELLSIVEQEGSVKMNCQYCHAEYNFDAIDVEAIHKGQGTSSNLAH